MYYRDYCDQIMQMYKTKITASDFSLNLKEPTPARLRDECAIVFKERYHRKDEGTLRTFFGSPVDESKFMRTIEKFSIDKFRPLINYINDPAIETGSKNVELLAWLIDFEPRPLARWGQKGKQPVSGEAEVDDEKTDYAVDIVDATGNPSALRNTLQSASELSTEKSGPSHEKFFQPKRITQVLIAVVLLAAVTNTIYWAGKNQTTDNVMTAFSSPPDKGACMYWTGDHYEPVPCGPKSGDIAVVPMDAEKMRKLKRLTAPETITENDIGRLTYAKLPTGMEYYTDTGMHPVHVHRRLKRLTKGMFEKYILPLKQADLKKEDSTGGFHNKQVADAD